MAAPVSPGGAAPRPERVLTVAIAITLLALALRIVYFTGAQVQVPLRGDIVEYWFYGWNLAHHGVFSRAEPSLVVPMADAWRGPGYPAFLAACMRLTPDDVSALALAQWLQILLGALLAPLTIVLGRRFLPTAWALLAGLGVAIWPHLVVFSSTLLSETVFGFAVLAVSILTARGQARDSAPLAGVAGFAAGLTNLINPLFGLFPPAIAAVLAWRGQRRVALTYLLGFVLVAGAWSWRNHGLDHAARSSDRVVTNLVQGSWPLFLYAMQDRSRNDIAKAYFEHVEAEIADVRAHPRAGLKAMAARFRTDPATYAQWYLLEKPWLLCDWSVRAGWGDVYFHETQRSPYERVAAMRWMHALCKALNPVVFALAVLAGLAACWRVARGGRRGAIGEDPAARAREFALLHAVLFCGYVTAVHVVLQGEPRYAVAYRPIELLLAVAALAAGMQWLRQRAGRRAAPPQAA
jgi:hypothetical protein